MADLASFVLLVAGLWFICMHIYLAYVKHEPDWRVTGIFTAIQLGRLALGVPLWWLTLFTAVVFAAATYHYWSEERGVFDAEDEM